MAKLKNERDFQNFLKDTIKAQGGYYTQLHPGQGSDVGIPDLIIGTDTTLLPSEVKIGSIADDNKTIWSRQIRPAQIAWHERITSHGHPSCVLIGVWQADRWRCFVVFGSDAPNVRNGFLIGKDAIEIDTRFFLDELDVWVQDVLGVDF